MKKIFITNIIYKNSIFSIYCINGKLEMSTDDKNVNMNDVEELNKILFTSHHILKANKIVLKSIIGAIALTTSLNFIGNIKTSELDKLTESSKTSEIFDEETFHQNYMNAIRENKYLSEQEKKLFEDRYNFVVSAHEYIYDIDSLLNMLQNIKIEKIDEYNSNLIGCFTFDNNEPTIKLYKGADHWTLIHEIYHALKYSENYYTNPYLYNGRFIDINEFNLLSKEEQTKCIKYDIIGNFFEEGLTSLLTTKDRKYETDELIYDYEEESYIYNMYEKILGKDIMMQNAFNTSKITIFLNSLLDLGYDTDSVISIATKLDLYETIKYNPNENIDTTQLKYGICDDLINIYQKKYGNTDNKLLELITLDMIKDLDFKRIQEFEHTYNMKDYYEKIMNGDISVRKLLNTVNYDFNDKYGINDITLDISSDNEIYVSIMIDYNHNVILKLDSNNNLKFIKEESEKYPYEYKLYDDYYEYAMNTWNNERYAIFFASCYTSCSKKHITEKERNLIMEEFEKLHGDLNIDDFKDLMLFGNYKKIMRNLEKFYYAARFKEK